jgi:hypothetical protein
MPCDSSALVNFSITTGGVATDSRADQRSSRHAPPDIANQDTTQAAGRLATKRAIAAATHRLRHRKQSISCPQKPVLIRRRIR